MSNFAFNNDAVIIVMYENANAARKIAIRRKTRVRENARKLSKKNVRAAIRKAIAQSHCCFSARLSKVIHDRMEGVLKIRSLCIFRKTVECGHYYFPEANDRSAQQIHSFQMASSLRLEQLYFNGDKNCPSIQIAIDTKGRGWQYTASDQCIAIGKLEREPSTVEGSNALLERCKNNDGPEVTLLVFLGP